MTKPSDELLRRAGELGNSLPHCCGYPECDGDLVAEPHSEGCPMFPDEKELTSIELAAQFAEQIVREIAQEADDEFSCDCGADDADWKRKKAGKMYNTECGHAIECPKFKIAEILRKFGLKE